MQIVIRSCFLGHLLIAKNERGVCALFLGDDEGTLRAELGARFPGEPSEPAERAFEKLAEHVVERVEQGEFPEGVPLDLNGTEFQRRVWCALREIPRGVTLTYSELAARLGAPGSARAVGSACGKNSIALAVPCHRVVREDGGLGGYRWGLERKRVLLDRERSRAVPRPEPQGFR